MFETSLCQILFYLLAVVAILCAAGVVGFRSPINSAMSMALCFAMVAIIFFGMGAQFLGIVQCIVYAGAILVLFLFVVMMLDIHGEEHSRGSYIHAAVGMLIAGFVAGLLIKAALDLPGAKDNTCPAITLCESAGELLIGEARQVKEAPAAAPQYGGCLPELSAAAAARLENPAISEADAAKATSIPDVKLLGQCLYTRYNIPFVILSFALLAGTVGAVALARKIRKD
ncbi:MAG: NADH-quinone oxidoreductase subunit J [Akkermansia sp.]|nr:NADH-quinone oxidoreductase subunit J [Akkermansia sp.]MBR2313619.1 NADH-quinone oxidoreductase subunit J [Akkermansia sp.]